MSYNLMGTGKIRREEGASLLGKNKSNLHQKG
jgi:hypothetical protein